jgi:hypothetical protein
VDLLRRVPGQPLAFLADVERHRGRAESRCGIHIDAQTVRIRVGEILVHITLRIDHHRLTSGGIADQIARVRQTPEVVLTEEHLAFRMVDSTRVTIPLGVLVQASDGDTLWGMCRQTTCPTCHKPTWAGCGAHIEQVLRDVRLADRCQCSTAPRSRKVGWMQRRRAAKRTTAS